MIKRQIRVNDRVVACVKVPDGGVCYFKDIKVLIVDGNMMKVEGYDKRYNNSKNTCLAYTCQFKVITSLLQNIKITLNKKGK